VTDLKFLPETSGDEFRQRTPFILNDTQIGRRDPGTQRDLLLRDSLWLPELEQFVEPSPAADVFRPLILFQADIIDVKRPRPVGTRHIELKK
jgi:hypothetical protein